MTFRRTFVAVIAVLAVLVATFAVLDRAQGPKLSSMQVDPVALASQPGQTVQLAVNQAISRVKASQVTVTPKAPFRASASGLQVTVQFARPLSYATTYRVTVKDVRSADDGAVATLRSAFSTPAAQLYYLHRSGSTAPDEIRRTTPTGRGAIVVYSAPRIQDFAVLDGSLAVVTVDAHGNSSLAIVSSSRTIRSVRLPGAGSIGLLHANSVSDQFAFTFTSAGSSGGYVQDLFTLADAPGAKPVAVKGLGGTPLAAINWLFVPGSANVVILGSNGNVELVDPTNPNSTTPFANYFTLDSISNDGTTVGVSDINGALSLALPTGKPTRITPSRLDGKQPIGGATQSVPGGVLQIDSVYGDAVGSFTEHLVFDNGTTSRQLYSPANPLGSIDSFSVSPGNQFVAIEVTPDVATAKPDGYQLNGRPTSVETVVVDAANGKSLGTLPGFDAQWSTVTK